MAKATMIANQPLLGLQRPEAVRYALRGAVTVALLIGAAEHQAGAHGAGGRGRIEVQLARGHIEQAVALGEAAVAKAPQDAALRAALGQAYLRAGRFESAASVFGDAVALSDISVHTTLALALAQIACGQNRAALATLDHGAAIPPADLGLALALAGDTDRGIAVLSDGVHEGAASPILRQNLAYAFALAGRWADARLTGGLDLPADQLDTSLQNWARSMQSGGERARIARLLNVPLVADQGMPMALARQETVPAPPLAVANGPAMALAAASPIPPIVAIPGVAAPMQAENPEFHPAAQVQRVAPSVGHFVQLGAYHSLRSAERGKLVLAKRHPQLRGHGLLIAQAKVHGRSQWRVVMTGFDRVTASSTCATLQHHGIACFAYAVKTTRQRALLAVSVSAGTEPGAS